MTIMSHRTTSVSNISILITMEHDDPFLNEDDKPHPRQYGAPEGSARDKKLDRLTKMAKSSSAKVRKAAYAGRERMEKAEREKPGWKNRPRTDTKKEGIDMDEAEELNECIGLIRELIAEVLNEELSAKTKATLRKKAEKRGLTPGSVEAEYKKGLAAWASSGSRKGMSQHQWAMARVNSANPSKDWAVVKKSKAKKKK
jgi:Family of unknown function (DUF5824)